MKARRQEAAEKRAATAAAKKRVEEVIPYLRELGCRADEARYAAQCCERIPDAPLVERVRLAVRQLGPRGCRPRGAANAAATAPSIAEEPAPI